MSLWHICSGILFADLPHNVIRKWDPRHGASVVRTRTGYAAADLPPGGSMGSNGMTLDGRRVLRNPTPKDLGQHSKEIANGTLKVEYDA